MAKIFLVLLLLCAFSISGTSLLAAPLPGSTANYTLKADECDAPAPDDFRITSIGGDFISLAWQPAWVGATQLLSVSTKNSLGGWMLLYTLPNVPGSSITVDNLNGGKEYRFGISTKCPSGEVSERTSIIDGIALIVDLTLSGRIPFEPQTVSCSGIVYEDHTWVGFEVIRNQNGISNRFHVDLKGLGSIPFGSIRRVTELNPIVAVAASGGFPTSFNSIIEDVFLPFKMSWVNADDQDDIGHVGIKVTTTNPLTIDLCPILNDPAKPWNSSYTFNSLTASIALKPRNEGEKEGQSFENAPNFNVQNPFFENLIVSIPQGFQTGNKASIQLISINGQVILTQTFELLGSQVSFPVVCPPGVYFLQIGTDCNIQVLKVIK